jgi:hypothetical protein
VVAKMAVRIKIKEEKQYTLSGVIVNPGRYQRGCDRDIKIISLKGNEYDVSVCSDIFSNYNEDDIIRCKLIKDSKDNYLMVDKPFITFSTERTAVERAFCRALRPFSASGAEELYYNIMEKMKSRPRSEDEKNGIDVYGTDRVIYYLSDASEIYKETGDKEIVKNLEDCGLKDVAAKKLLKWWYKNRCVRKLHLLGMKNEEIKRCHMTCDEIYIRAIKNPLTLASIPMDICLFIMEAINIQPTNKELRCGEIIRKVYDLVENCSNACVSIHSMEYYFKDIWSHIDLVCSDYGLVQDGKLLYQKYNYDVEMFLAEYIDKLIKLNPQDVESLPTINDEDYVIKTLTQEQKNAINGALNNKISIITGAGGCGKSLAANEIFVNLKKRGIKFKAASFTGKAVVRLNEIFRANDPELKETVAYTLDYMVTKYKKSGDTNVGDFEVILIDEASMVSSELFYRFLTTFTHKFSIIFMGDCNQLKPISWGFFLKQIIASERIPIYTLTKNQRLKPAAMTAEEEEKYELALKGKAPSEISFDRTVLENCENLIDPKRNLSRPMIFSQGDSSNLSQSKGFYIFDEDMEFIRTILKQFKKGGTSYYEITCICPYIKFGYIEDINRMFQDVFFEDIEGVMGGRTMWKVGDRVKMLINNYDTGIMNGEEGIVMFTCEEFVEVQFKNKINKGVVTLGTPDFLIKFYLKRDDEDLEEVEGEGRWDGDKFYINMIKHSSCITVHGSQGSEYPYVIGFIPEVKDKKGNLSNFLNIPLLYVLMSRTQSTALMITNQEILGKISMTKPRICCDNLANRISNMRDETVEKNFYKVTIKEKEQEEEEEEYPEDDFFDEDAWEN